jgi:hypothetical protein
MDSINTGEPGWIVGVMIALVLIALSTVRTRRKGARGLDQNQRRSHWRPTHLPRLYATLCSRTNVSSHAPSIGNRTLEVHEAGTQRACTVFYPFPSSSSCARFSA